MNETSKEYDSLYDGMYDYGVNDELINIVNNDNLVNLNTQNKSVYPSLNQNKDSSNDQIKISPKNEKQDEPNLFTDGLSSHTLNGIDIYKNNKTVENIEKEELDIICKDEASADKGSLLISKDSINCNPCNSDYTNKIIENDNNNNSSSELNKIIDNSNEKNSINNSAHINDDSNIIKNNHDKIKNIYEKEINNDIKSIEETKDDK